MATASGSREGGGSRYALLAEIGSGEIASIHFGRVVDKAGLARTVVIKKLYARFAQDPEFVAALLAEARLVARIRHPNLVPTLDVVRDGLDVLLVTEYVAGETLAEFAEATRPSGKRLDLRVACAVLVNALQGLHAAHEAKNEFSEPLGLVHGNLSPASILVGVDGVARLVDFGVSKAIQRQLPYRAPEQVRGMSVTRATDVWGAAVVFWEVLAGEPLFRADDDAALARAILGNPIRDPSEVASVPPVLGAIARRGLERDPRRRFGTAEEMAAAIAQALPLAPPSEIAACLERACGVTIAKRADVVREVESAATRTAPPAPPIVPSGEFIADALWGDPSKPAPPLSPSPGTSIGSVPPAEIARAREATPSARDTRAPAAWRWGVRIGAVAILSLLALGAASFCIPWYAKEQAIAAAAARGVSVTIDDATGGFGSVTFHGVAAGVLDVPGAHATVDELEIELRGFRPARATLRHAEVSLDGPFSKTLALAALWYAGHDGRTRGVAAGDGVQVLVRSARVRWSHAFGEDGQMEAEDVTGDLVPTASARIGDEFQFTTSKLTLRSKPGTLGPWRVDLRRDPDALDARVAFDPPVPDGPNAMITRMNTGKTSVEINIPRSPLYRIGIPPAVLADLRQAPDQAEVRLRYTRMPDDRISATFAATLFGLRAPPLAGPVDVKIGGSIGGSASSPLDLQGGVFAVGPVRATLAGPVVIGDSVRATLTWRAEPIPCAQLLPKSGRAAADLAGQLGALSAGGGDLASLGMDVTALAQSAGFARVSGNLEESGTLVFDSSDLPGTQFAASGRNSCGVSLFAGR